MKQHPIPQDITGYRFHIVGNMTLKQFTQVGAGVLVAVVIYNTNLLVFIKWPLIIFSVGLGGMMAFVPIEERPLDHWITTFLKRLYKPTKFYWKKENKIPFALTEQKKIVKRKKEPTEIDLTPARRKRIEDYIKSVKAPLPKEDWDLLETKRVTEILNVFDEVEVKEVNSKPQKVKPKLIPRVRNLPADKKKKTDSKGIVLQTNKKIKPLEKPTETPKLSLKENKVIPPLKSAKTSSINSLAAPVEIFADEEVMVKPA